MQNNTKKYTSKQPYKAQLTRRETLKWLGLLSASTALPVSAFNLNKGSVKSLSDNWPNIKLKPITATGYGKDPNLIIAPKSAWPKTLTNGQLTLVATISDIIVPKDGDYPAASTVNVPDVVDEWLSAPYQWQQHERVHIMNLLAWLDDESARRSQLLFVDCHLEQQLNIINDIAYKTSLNKDEFRQPAIAFSKLRRLVLAAYFCSPQGTKDIGYLGNVPIAGDYPGPTKEAYMHLDKTLHDLGLTL